MNENIGRYQLIDIIGESSSGIVYLARDASVGREVALKVFSGEYDDLAYKRFTKEIEAAGKLNHPAIVPVFDAGEYEKKPYYVMPYMSGGSLKTRLEKGGPLSPQEASEFLSRLASALDTIHKAGLVHRNIKPSNILLGDNGEPYLGDFAFIHTTRTVTQAFVGTPAYMSPEQIMGQELDNRTDIYLLGLVLFEVLTGKRPFPGITIQDIIRERIQDGQPPSLHTLNPNLAADYDKITIRALAKNPEERYENATEMTDELSVLVSMAGQVTIVEPVPNPFVVGNPVAGNLFVGRAEIFTQLKELWGNNAAHNVNSVVLFGHRRMGKTSILQNLHHYFKEDTLVAGLTMQRVGRVNSSGELLNYLALAIYDALEDAGIIDLAEPDLDTFEHNGYAAFNRFLRDVRRYLNDSNQRSGKKESRLSRLFKFKTEVSNDENRIKRVILTIDEFELIEAAIADGRVDAEFLDFLRGVIHSEHWLILALAGLHTLEEMTADYWNPLFASVTPIRVSFFSRTATNNLLSHLGDNFPLTFTNATVDRIYELVQGQPYLTQLIAYNLVSTYNQAAFEQGKIRTPEFTPQDVDQVINSPLFYDQGSYYFNGVWGQAEKSKAKGQTKIMQTLAQSTTPLTKNELVTQTNLNASLAQESIVKLQQHDVLRQTQNGRFAFTVPLMQRWIQDIKL